MRACARTPGPVSDSTNAVRAAGGRWHDSTGEQPAAGSLTAAARGRSDPLAQVALLPNHRSHRERPLHGSFTETVIFSDQGREGQT